MQEVGRPPPSMPSLFGSLQNWTSLSWKASLDLYDHTLQLQSFVAYGESNGKVGGVVGTGKGSVGKLKTCSSMLHGSCFFFDSDDLGKKHGIWQHAPSLEVAAPFFQPTARPQWKGVVWHQWSLQWCFLMSLSTAKSCKTVTNLNQPNKQKACRRRWINTWDLLASVWSGQTPSSQILHTPGLPGDETSSLVCTRKWRNIRFHVAFFPRHNWQNIVLLSHVSTLNLPLTFCCPIDGPYLDHPSS